MVGLSAVSQGTWTHESRMLALKDEIRSAFIGYFHGSMKERNWVPWDAVPLDEIRQRLGALSADTLTLCRGLLGIEDYVGEYLREGLDLLKGWRGQRNLHLAWGAEELRHSEALALLLTSAGEDEADVKDYRDAVLSHRWLMAREQPGLKSSLGMICYALFQERTSCYLYEALRRRVRGEYGLTEELTESEREQGQETGAAGVFKLILGDERAHYAVYSEIARSYLRFFPRETLQTLQQALRQFELSALETIPGAEQFTEALERTGIFNAAHFAREVRDVILAALGFAGPEALDRAAEEAQQLTDEADLGVVSFGSDGALVRA